MAAVPHGDVVGDTGEKTALCDTERHTGSEETSEVGDETHASHANTPSNHDDANPERWRRALHHQVGRNLREDVPREEDGKRDLKNAVSNCSCV